MKEYYAFKQTLYYWKWSRETRKLCQIKWQDDDDKLYLNIHLFIFHTVVELVGCQSHRRCDYVDTRTVDDDVCVWSLRHSSVDPRW